MDDLQSRTSLSFTVYDANKGIFLFRLISIHQCLIKGHGRLHVPPFTFNILLLIWWFTLTHVTMNSSAPNFTITMASSENPHLITSTLLQRLGLKESQLLRPKRSTALHWVR